MDRTTAFESCPELAALSNEVKNDMLASGREFRFAEGERLVSMVHPRERMLILATGVAMKTGVAANGVERILRVHRPGDLIGVGTVLAPGRSDHEVVAWTAGSAVAIARSRVLAVTRDHPEIMLALTRIYARELTTVGRLLLAAMSDDVPLRLADVLLGFADGGGDGGSPDAFVPLVCPLTHETLSRIIGASRPHTSTVLRDLEQAGAVRRNRRRLLVRPDRLAALARGGAAA